MRRMHPSVQRLYDGMSHLLGNHKQSDLARLLGETSQQIHAWERRGVSERGALKVQEQHGINATWILNGSGTKLILQPSTAQSEAGILERVRTALRLASVSSIAQLVAALGLTAEQVATALAALNRRGEALAAAGPGEPWVAPRLVPDITGTGTVPVFQVHAGGDIDEFGTLVPTTHGRYWMEERAGVNQLHDGLPWFLQDMRPQGFLGRSFALAHPALQFPPRPDLWTEDHVLRALALAGEALPGNLIVGARSFERFMNRVAPERAAVQRYPELAAAAMQGAAPGSFAGGEQPKFSCVREDGVHVLVKFSPPQDTAVGQRWADLLVCEHLALEQLGAEGISAARTRIYRGGGRTFLGVERFVGTMQGRIRMVSLQAYDSEYVGQIDNWAATAERMQRQNLLTAEDAQTLRFLEVLGLAIANTDRHYGNVSLLIDAAGDWKLAPAYDQLPMHYAPVAGEIVRREYPTDLQFRAETRSVWSSALAAGLRFWNRVATDESVSAEFRSLAAGTHAPALHRLLDATPT